MNPTSGISFYDALTKLTTGFLILLFFMLIFPDSFLTTITSKLQCCHQKIEHYTDLSVVQTSVFILLCFIVGSFWQTMIDYVSNKTDKIPAKCKVCIISVSFVVLSVCYGLFCFAISKFDCFSQKGDSISIGGVVGILTSLFIMVVVVICCFVTFLTHNKEWHLADYIPFGKRNDIDNIIKSKASVRNSYVNNECVKGDYLRAYYNVQKNGLLGNIPTLEALEAFFRYNFVIAVLYTIYFTFVCEFTLSRCMLIKILIIAFCFILWCATWYKTQMKIHELVWEADLYLDIINKKERK